MKYILFLLIVTVYSAYAQKPKNDKTIQIQNEFNEEAIKWFKNTGNSAIKGTAKFKSLKGNIHFGKQFWIELLPNSAYTKERLNHIYKNDDSGYIHIESGLPKFTPDPKGFHQTKKVTCNEKGEFEFTNLPEGDYYVIAFMLWDKTGGGIMRHLKLVEGETRVIEMTNF